LPHCRSLILTTFGKPGFLRRAMETGAYGFLLKDAPPEQLAHAIRRTARGERVVDPGLAASALSEGVSPLTERERQVLAATVRVGHYRAWVHRRSASDLLLSRRRSIESA